MVIRESVRESTRPQDRGISRSALRNYWDALPVRAHAFVSVSPPAFRKYLTNAEVEFFEAFEEKNILCLYLNNIIPTRESTNWTILIREHFV